MTPRPSAASAPALIHGKRCFTPVNLFRTDEEGFLYFVGRKDDIIKTAAKRCPKEVETVLHAHPGIAEAVVIGVPDPVLGAAIGALVVLSDPTLTEKDIIRHCSRHLEISWCRDRRIPHRIAEDGYRKSQPPPCGRNIGAAE